jgi:hypothetical protein
MLLRIQPYEITLSYKPGKDMAYADYLSRTQPTPGPTIQLERTIHLVQISDGQLERLRVETEQDPQLSALRTMIANKEFELNFYGMAG